VETRAELDCLARLGVPLVQGYHLARPGPGWPQIDTETSLHLMTSEPLRTGTTLRSLLEPTVTVSDTDTADPLSWFIDDTVDLVVLIDRALRPVATITSTGPLRSLVHGILINLDTGVAQVRAPCHHPQRGSASRAAGVRRQRRTLRRHRPHGTDRAHPRLNHLDPVVVESRRDERRRRGIVAARRLPHRRLILAV